MRLLQTRAMVAWPLAAVLLLSGRLGAAEAEGYLPPEKVSVLPIFLVPKGEAPPTRAQAVRLMRHLTWAQKAYRKMLGGQITFEIARRAPLVFHSPKTLNFFRGRPEGGAPDYVAELLPRLEHNRHTCPYILLTVVMNPQDAFPKQGGRSLNGGVNTGGGFIQLASFVLDKVPNMQSLLRHELGHSFGLPHVDAYGYDMKSNPSIMSYSPAKATTGFRESQTPGRLIPEDLRLLAINDRVFPGLDFNLRTDVPQGYRLHDEIRYTKPMTIPGQPKGVVVTTDSGEAYNSKVAHIAQGRIETSRDDGSVSYNSKTMWHSAVAADGWVSVELEFPMPVELTAIRVYSQHSGKYHPAQAARIAVRDEKGEMRAVCEQPLKAIDATVTFPRAKAQTWRLELAAGPSRQVVVRGLRFYSGEREIFPPLLVEPEVANR